MDCADAIDHRFDIGLLGVTRFLVDGRDATPRGRKTRAVLALICIAGGAPVDRSRVAGLLWARSGEAQARASLRQALLEIAGGPLRHILSVRRDILTLAIPASCIDLFRLKAGIADLGDGAVEPISPGPLLDDLDGLGEEFDQWLRQERSHVSEALSRPLRAALAAAGQTRPKDTVELARRLLAIDPTDEAAAKTAMIACCALGLPSDALKIHAALRDALRLMLDSAPEPEIERLARAARMTARGASLETPPPADPAIPSGVPEQGGGVSVGVVTFRVVGAQAETALGQIIADQFAGALARFRHLLVRSCETAAAGARCDFVVDGVVYPDPAGLTVTAYLSRGGSAPQMLWNQNARIAAGDPATRGERLLAAFAEGLQAVLLHHTDRLVKDGTTAASLTRRALPLLASMERPRFEKAGRLLAEARTLDKTYGGAAVWHAWWYLNLVGRSWADRPTDAVAAARSAVEQALELDPFDAEATAIAAHVTAFGMKDREAALALHARAAELNSNLPMAWALRGLALSYVGRMDEALEGFERYAGAATGDPMAPLLTGSVILPLLLRHDYERTVAVGRRAVATLPGYTSHYKPLLAACGHLGLKQEAAAHLSSLLRHEPGYSLERSVEFRTFEGSSDMHHYLDGLGLAGVPLKPDSEAK